MENGKWKIEKVSLLYIICNTCFFDKDIKGYETEILSALPESSHLTYLIFVGVVILNTVSVTGWSCQVKQAMPVFPSSIQDAIILRLLFIQAGS